MNRSEQMWNDSELDRAVIRECQYGDCGECESCAQLTHSGSQSDRRMSKRLEELEARYSR